MENGEQFANVVGIQMLLRLYVENLDIHMVLDPFKAAMLLTVLDRYGWVKSIVPEENEAWAVVCIQVGQTIFVTTEKTLVSNVSKLVIKQLLSNVLYNYNIRDI